jgi:arylsulfatase A-like enzyme
VPEKYCAPYASLPEPRRTYARMVAAMDEAIGGILAALDACGLRTNTLIFFSSDNGGPNPGRVTSNGPLRAGKGTVYEGGTRVCACVAWQGHIKPGTAIAQPLHMVDWYPTLLKLGGASPDQKLPLDGRDILPVLTLGKRSPHEEILLNTSPRAGAIRVGDWKLVLNGSIGTAEEDDESPAPARGKKAARRNQPPKVELFNLAQDLSEKHDLAADNPEKVKELRARYDALAKQAAKPGNKPRPPDYTAPKVYGEQE